MSKRIKSMQVKELAGGLSGRDSCVVVGLGPLDVLSATELRNRLREQGLALKVLKNRLARKAFESVGWEELGSALDGASAVAFGDGGALAASKILVEWEKSAAGAIMIRGGMLDGKKLDVEEIRLLATIPDKPVLYSMLAAVVVAPVTQIACLINDVLAGVARAVGAVAEKQGA